MSCRASCLLAALAILACSVQLERVTSDDVVATWAQSWDEGLDKVKEQAKPGMVVIHRSWCEHCEKLMPAFALGELHLCAGNFVLINMDDSNHADADVKALAPDGEYFPRIFFIGKDGEINYSLKGTANKNFSYYYQTPSEVVKSMVGALRKLGGDSAGCGAGIDAPEQSLTQNPPSSLSPCAHERTSAEKGGCHNNPADLGDDRAIINRNVSTLAPGNRSEAEEDAAAAALSRRIGHFLGSDNSASSRR